MGGKNIPSPEDNIDSSYLKTSNRWLLREVRYPQWKPLDARSMDASTEIKLDGYGPVWNDTLSVTRIELLWQPWSVNTGIGEGYPFPTFQDMLDGIYMAEYRYGKQPDVIVVTPPAGTTYFGVEIR